MSDAPERIWLGRQVCDYDGVSADIECWSTSCNPEEGGEWVDGPHEYIRAVLVAPPQITDAMVDAAMLATLGRNWPSTQTMRAALAAGLKLK